MMVSSAVKRIATFYAIDDEERMPLLLTRLRGLRRRADAVVLEQVTLPFGAALEPESTRESARRFTSYDRGATTRMDYAVSRYCLPQLGRFVQVDPLKVGAVKMGDPHSNNQISYSQCLS
jgi:RHS repeat-associated protein